MKTQSVVKTAVTLVLICASIMSFSQNQHGTVTGVVINKSTSQPISKAEIGVYQQTRKNQTVYSNDKGAFSISLAPGMYTLQIRAKGFSVSSVEVYIQSGKTVTVRPQLEHAAPVIVEINDVEMDMSIALEKVMEKPHRMHYSMATIGYAVPSPQQPYPLYQSEDYDVIHENGFRDAHTSPFSTFSVDVDRASYANVRRFLQQQNRLPNPDAVRIEEMINYFDYSYPQPKKGDPFSITVESTGCPWNNQNSLILIGLQGEQVAVNNIPPSNLVFLIDVSGSMHGPNRLGLVKQAFDVLVSQLRPQDRVSIVIYAGNTGVILEPTPGNQKEKISAAIHSLEAQGSTHGYAGIQKAYELAKKTYIHGGNNRVIIASDGDFNVGIQSTSELVRFIETQRDEHIYLTVLGFGMGNYKDSRFEQLSNAGNGNYAYIDNLNEAKKMFGQELWGTLYTIADDVKIQVEFNPAIVKSYRLIGYENRLLATEDFTNDKKDAGEVGSGHSVTALYEVEFHAEARTTTESQYITQVYANTQDVMTVQVRYKDPGTETSKLLSKPVTKKELVQGKNIEFAASVAEFGMVLRNSEFKGTASYDSILSKSKIFLQEDEFGYRKEFVQLVERAKSLQKL